MTRHTTRGRMHKVNAEGYVTLTECGLLVLERDCVNSWRKVTCKKCIRARQREEKKGQGRMHAGLRR